MHFIDSESPSLSSRFRSYGRLVVAASSKVVASPLSIFRGFPVGCASHDSGNYTNRAVQGPYKRARRHWHGLQVSWGPEHRRVLAQSPSRSRVDYGVFG